MPRVVTRPERWSPDIGGLARSADLLRRGRLVAFATETVYGLGADATNAQAVAALFEAKGRPRFNPLICHYPSASAAWQDVIPSNVATTFAEAFWPGPLTMVLPKRPGSRVADLTGAGLNTLAVRIPNHPDALALLAAVGLPVAAPSANRSGQLSPTEAAHVMSGLGGRIDAVLDSGPCPVGVESTVLDLTGTTPALLRPGGLTIEAIEQIIGPIEREIADPTQRRSPGLLASHYAPSLPLRLDATFVEENEALLAFGTPLTGGARTFNLSVDGDLHQAAARLFAGLHWLDRLGAEQNLIGIAAMKIPETGVGLAIRDRLKRAAAPRT